MSTGMPFGRLLGLAAFLTRVSAFAGHFGTINHASNALYLRRFTARRLHLLPMARC